MDGLQSQLKPDRLFPVYAGTQIQHLVRQTVRPCADGQCYNLGVTDGGGKQCFQVRERCVGVGIGLEVGNVGIRCGTHFAFDTGDSFFNLLMDRGGNQGCLVLSRTVGF